jgi:spore coat protein U-like protein
MRSAFGVTFIVAAMLTSTEACAQSISCTINSTGLSFSVYDPLSPSPLDSVGKITISCKEMTQPKTDTVPYAISIFGGTGRTGRREMRGGADVLLYGLYNSPVRSQATLWGDGTAGTVVVTGVAGPFPQRGQDFVTVHSVYGRIDAGQDVAVGQYDDSVVVRLDF